jgi:hypothetical protein
MVWISCSRASDLAFEQLQLFLRDALFLLGLVDQGGGGLDLLGPTRRVSSPDPCAPGQG